MSVAFSELFKVNLQIESEAYSISWTFLPDKDRSLSWMFRAFLLPYPVRKANYRICKDGHQISPSFPASRDLLQYPVHAPQSPFPVQIAEGRIDLSNEDLRWSEAKVEFGQSSLVMNGSWKHGEKVSPLEAMVKGGIDLKNLLTLSQAPFFPEEVRSKAKEIETLSGTGQLSFRLKSLSVPGRFS
jgi:hypothetical protein